MHRFRGAVVGMCLIVFATSGCTSAGTKAPPTTTSAAASATTPAPATSMTATATTAIATPTPTPTADAAAIVTAMTAAVKSATSVHYSGSINQANAHVTLDMTADGARNARGTIDFGIGVVQIVAAKGTLYIRAGKAVWKKQGAPASSIPTIADKWVKLPPATAANYETFTDFHSFVDGLEKASYTNAGTDSVDGVDVIVLKDGTETVYVAAADPHFPLKAMGASAAEGSITFADWNKPVTITAPKGAIDLKNLAK